MIPKAPVIGLSPTTMLPATDSSATYRWSPWASGWPTARPRRSPMSSSCPTVTVPPAWTSIWALLCSPTTSGPWALNTTTAAHGQRAEAVVADHRRPRLHARVERGRDRRVLPDGERAGAVPLADADRSGADRGAAALGHAAVARRIANGGHAGRR